MSKVIIKNFNGIITGDTGAPRMNAEVVYIEDGIIRHVGVNDIEGEVDVVVDAKELTLCPGLIDAHGHPPVNDYLPDFKAVDWAENFMGGGITSIISVGNIRMPGVPDTVAGTKAMAIVGKQVWDNNRVKGFKMHGGALMLVDGLEEKDFRELSNEGIGVVGEIGMSSVKDVKEASKMAGLARDNGFIVTAHSGGASGYDCASYGADDLMEINPDVICHLNGAPTPMKDEDIKRVVTEGDFYYDLVTHGNVRVMLDAVKLAEDSHKLDKLMLGTNTPSMAGYSPMGLWTNVAAICNVYRDMDPAVVIGFATGNVARCYGLRQGFLKEGYMADILFLDAAYPDTDISATLRAGNMPSVATVMVDGALAMAKCKNTPGPSVRPEFIYN